MQPEYRRKSRRLQYRSLSTCGPEARRGPTLPPLPRGIRRRAIRARFSRAQLVVEAPSWLRLYLVDIHSHILYGMDDGSKTLEQSIEMLQMAAAAGTTELVCTPHANRDFKFEPLVIRERLKELEAGIGMSLRPSTRSVCPPRCPT